MAYVVADPCVKCKYTDCVEICPVNCFYEGENALVINPSECIDCGSCVPECPVNAIFEQSDLPDKWSIYQEINAVFSGDKSLEDADVSDWPSHLVDGYKGAWSHISAKQDPLPNADQAASEDSKLSNLSPKSAK
ncbi:4Fe-4S dicluster domain-containing protein [Coleofasciculus sp.]|uniref:4Fe-4S dicluster domain-containing protein n=1 Tax=Coleofasciculus sp. TaxID=3100458 RepID=UPI003A366F3F